MDDLKKPNANLYLYLAATESQQGKEAADSFCKYFKEYSPKKAIALVYLKLQNDGGITIGTKHYQSPEELKNEKDASQIALVEKALTEKDSTLLVWLSDMYGDNLKTTDGINNLSTPELVFLLGLLPLLTIKKVIERHEEQERQEKECIIKYRERIAKSKNCISAGHFCTVGLRADGTVVAVGRNEYDQCNTGSWRDIVAIAAGGWDTVGLKADGTVVAVGGNKDGQGNTGNWRDIVAITACHKHTVGLKADGTVVAVGKNNYNQCNTGSWKDIVAVAAGDDHTVGLKADGTVVAVGENFNGQCNTENWRDIGPVPEEKLIELKHHAEQERFEQQHRAEQERIEQERRAEQERVEQQRREEQSKRWQEQGLCQYCGGKLGGLIKKKCKDCGREN